MIIIAFLYYFNGYILTCPTINSILNILYIIINLLLIIEEAGIVVV
jgi:hypothetical protein